MEMESQKTVYLGPAEGVGTVRIPGAQLVTRKVAAEQTGGAYSLFEVEVRPGGSEPPHIQHREDECLYVLDGEFEFLHEDVRIGAGPGSLIYVPKGNLHAFRNVGEGVGRLLVIQTPGGSHELFVEETGKPVADGATPPATEEPPDVGRLAAIGAKYGIEMVPLPPP